MMEVARIVFAGLYNDLRPNATKVEYYYPADMVWEYLLYQHSLGWCHSSVDYIEVDVLSPETIMPTWMLTAQMREQGFRPQRAKSASRLTL